MFLKKYLFALNKACTVYISKKWTFEKMKKVFFFTSQLSCSHPLASLKKKRKTFYNNQNCTSYI